MNKPVDLDRGVEMFMKFHGLDPKHIGSMHVAALPSYAKRGGRMVNTKYASKKWEGKTNYYTHDHGQGVHIYFPSRSGTEVPASIRRVSTLVRLGRCISLDYINEKGEECTAKGDAKSDLYCTPSGRALVVVQDKSHIEAIIWGGKLCVEARGICY